MKKKKRCTNAKSKFLSLLTDSYRRLQHKTITNIGMNVS